MMPRHDGVYLSLRVIERKEHLHDLRFLRKASLAPLFNFSACLPQLSSATLQPHSISLEINNAYSPLIPIRVFDFEYTLFLSFELTRQQRDHAQSRRPHAALALSAIPRCFILYTRPFKEARKSDTKWSWRIYRTTEDFGSSRY